MLAALKGRKKGYKDARDIRRDIRRDKSCPSCPLQVGWEIRGLNDKKKGFESIHREDAVTEDRGCGEAHNFSCSVSCCSWTGGHRVNAAAAQNRGRCHHEVLPALLLGMSEAVGAGEREAHEFLAFHVQKKLLLAVLPKSG